jgi:20S proteasome subunit alpha 5
VSKRVKLPLVILIRIIDRFHTDPSGTFVRFDARAIGSGSEAAQSELQDKWHKVRHIYLCQIYHINQLWLATANVTSRSSDIDFEGT